MMFDTVRKSAVAALLVAPMVFAGCLGPTYGTGKTQGETLFDDLNNIASLGTGSDASEPIAYTPRAELVKPENTSVLPAPQAPRPATNLVESPEQRSARIRAAAYQGDGPVPAEEATRRKEGVTDAYLDRTTNGRSRFARDRESAQPLMPDELEGASALVAERAREARQGSPTQRKMLSEPPLDYRRPAASAPVGEIGESEEAKARRLRGSSSLSSKISDLLPF